MRKLEAVIGGYYLAFDQEAFSMIDSEIEYLNPNHFSVKQLVDVLEAKGANQT